MKVTGGGAVTPVESRAQPQPSVLLRFSDTVHVWLIKVLCSTCSLFFFFFLASLLFISTYILKYNLEIIADKNRHR